MVALGEHDPRASLNAAAAYQLLLAWLAQHGIVVSQIRLVEGNKDEARFTEERQW